AAGLPVGRPPISTRETAAPDWQTGGDSRPPNAPPLLKSGPAPQVARQAFVASRRDLRELRLVRPQGASEVARVARIREHWEELPRDPLPRSDAAERGSCERPDVLPAARVAEAHDLVHRLGGGDAVVDDPERFAQERVLQPIPDESRHVA